MLYNIVPAHMSAFKTGVSVLQASQDLLKEHYIDLKDRPFFPTLIAYMSSGPVVPMVSANTHGGDEMNYKC